MNPSLAVLPLDRGRAVSDLPSTQKPSHLDLTHPSAVNRPGELQCQSFVGHADAMTLTPRATLVVAHEGRERHATPQPKSAHALLRSVGCRQSTSLSRSHRHAEEYHWR